MSSTGNFTVAGTGIVSSSRSLGAGLAIAGSVVAGRASVNTWQRTHLAPLQRDAARAPLLFTSCDVPSRSRARGGRPPHPDPRRAPPPAGPRGVGARRVPPERGGGPRP